VSFRLEGKDAKQLKEVAAKLKEKLNTMEGVGDVNDSMQSATVVNNQMVNNQMVNNQMVSNQMIQVRILMEMKPLLRTKKTVIKLHESLSQL
ncbi:hypothetical protein, partial [Pseudoalteromonas sp. SR41-4]|uniref:hypothetical protein n=1 Tax=Pseudoalteromonas sp. SR41-4 TaxID=2760950 RepID=UPI001603AABB